MLYKFEREKLLTIKEDLIRYKLVDCTGGMLSVRCDSDHILMSTTGDSFRRWHMSLSDFIVTDLNGNIIEKTGGFSPAGTLVALELYKTFPLCNGILHTHSEYSHAFSSLNMSIPHSAHLIQTLGEVPCIKVEDKKIKDDYFAAPYPVNVPPCMANRPDIVAVNNEVIKQIESKMGSRRAELEGHGLAFTEYQHGIFVFAKSIDEAFENLARIESSARNYIYGSMILNRIQNEAH